MDADLKDYDDRLRNFVIFNFALFLLINFDFKFILENHQLISIILSLPVLYFPIYVINNVLSEVFKFQILYPRKHNHHFASDIFTKLCSGDIKYKKIDVDLIFEKHSHPKNFDEEDDLWYDIYWNHRYNQKVFEHHKQFLFCRDFTMMILPFTLFYFIILYLLKIPLNNFEIICLISIVEFIGFWFLTRFQNEKFVLVVLQEETYKLKK